MISTAGHEAMLTLALDRVTVNIVRQLDLARVPCIILKGPATASWLYRGEHRAYGDIDLLVPSEDMQVAAAVLQKNGFFDPSPNAAPTEVSAHARPYRNSRGIEIDLHHRLNGTTVPPALVWQELTADSILIPVAGTKLPVGSLKVQLLIVVLHAAQHGKQEKKPLRDLARAATKVTESEIREAAALAARLGASESFAAGLSLSLVLKGLVPDLATLPSQLTVVARLNSLYYARGVSTLLGLASGSVRSRFGVAYRAVFPTTDLLKVRSVGFSPGRIMMRARLSRWRYQMRSIPAATTRMREVQRIRRNYSARRGEPGDT